MRFDLSNSQLSKLITTRLQRNSNATATANANANANANNKNAPTNPKSQCDSGLLPRVRTTHTVKLLEGPSSA